MSSFAKLNRSIWSTQYNKLIQSAKLEHFVKHSKEFLLKNCYTIVNINGINFEDFADKHQFVKPNDLRAKHLMDHCAKSLLEQLKPHILLSYGFSDQFSFVLDRSSDFCGRNLTDILSVLVSSFTSNYVFNWRTYFDKQLKYAPAFKGTTLLLPNEESLVSYLLTKQHECYILNLNSTLYSALVGRYRRYDLNESDGYKLVEHQIGGELPPENKGETQKNARPPLSNEDALSLIKNEIDSVSKINEFLFKEYGINYNNEPELFRKGSLIRLDPKTSRLDSYHLKLNDKFLCSLLPEKQVTIRGKANSRKAEKDVEKDEVQQPEDTVGNQPGDPLLKKLKSAY